MPYKVVEKGTRFCSNWTMLKAEWKRRNQKIPLDFRKFKKRYPQFFPRYLKGSSIKKAPRSVGILCFKSKRQAEKFCVGYYTLRNAIIIEVQGIGKGHEGVQLFRSCGSDPNNLKCYPKGNMMKPPYGTIAFPKVKVLE